MFHAVRDQRCERLLTLMKDTELIGQDIDKPPFPHFNSAGKIEMHNRRFRDLTSHSLRSYIRWMRTSPEVGELRRV